MWFCFSISVFQGFSVPRLLFLLTLANFGKVLANIGNAGRRLTIV
jgi:hypothetical protein